MTPIIYAAFGAAGMAMAFGLFMMAKSLVHTTAELIDGLKGVAKLSASMEQMVKVGESVAQEVALLRTIMASTVPQAGDDNYSRSEQVPQPGRPPTPFPETNFGFYKQAPEEDAPESDFDQSGTEDKDMVALEKPEATRTKGFEAEEVL